MSRTHTQWIVLFTLLAALPACNRSAKVDDGLPEVRHMIDTHIHLYDTSREGGVPWPRENDTVLYKPHLPAEFTRVARPAGVTGVVIVEASHWPRDNKWVLDLVKDDDFYVALVGNLDVTARDFAEQLAELKKDPRVVGLRARKPGGVDYTDPVVLKNLRTLAEAGLSMDFLANGEGVKGVQQVDKLARQIPDLRIVANHVLGYNIDGTPPEDAWIEAVKKLAENPNVYCKVSGLYQRCVQQPAPQNADHYRYVLDVLWEHFGAERLIYGSNWPCTKKSGDYASFVRVVTAYFSEKGQDAMERYFWKNASRAYRLGLSEKTVTDAR